jgi:SAM-dependent methyltransferase
MIKKITTYMKQIIKNPTRHALNYLSKHIAMELQFHHSVNEATPEPALVLTDFNHYIHELRSFLVSSMPGDAHTILSVGCSGTWYFDWLTKEYGPVQKHIGIELFTPMPNDLPGNVQWIAATAGDMRAVADNSVDMLISGQNIEHLWCSDIQSFFPEAWRVLKPGAWLILDSPNGNITRLIDYRQPEHVAEYAPSDMRLLLREAGFRVVNEKGLLLMRGPDGAIMPLSPMHWHAGKESFLRRAMDGLSRPEDSFIWWFEAVKDTERPPDWEKFAAVCETVFNDAHKERINRVAPADAEWETSPDGLKMLCLKKERKGHFWHGPSIPLRKGRRVLKIELQADSLPDDRNAKVAVFELRDRSGKLYFEIPVRSGDFQNGISHLGKIFELEETIFGVEIICISTGIAELKIPLNMGLM